MRDMVSKLKTAAIGVATIDLGARRIAGVTFWRLALVILVAGLGQRAPPGLVIDV